MGNKLVNIVLVALGLTLLGGCSLFNTKADESMKKQLEQITKSDDYRFRRTYQIRKDYWLIIQDEFKGNPNPKYRATLNLDVIKLYNALFGRKKEDPAQYSCGIEMLKYN